MTVNVDNPFISDSNLSLEYYVACVLSGGLSKWDILRILLNGFKYASLPKFHRSKLVREMEAEIYELLLEES